MRAVVCLALAAVVVCSAAEPKKKGQETKQKETAQANKENGRQTGHPQGKFVGFSAVVDLFVSTKDFLLDCATLGYGHASSAVGTLEPSVRAAMESQPAVHNAMKTTRVHIDNLSELATAHTSKAASLAQDAYGKHASPLVDTVRKSLEVHIAALVQGFERHVPSQAGAIPRTLPDFLLFLAYMAVVLYVLLFKILRIVLRVVFFFAFLPCRICCGKKAKVAATKKNGAAKPAAKAAAPANGNAHSPKKKK